LYEHCSKPVQRTHHDWNGCGWHCSVFARAPGQAEYRVRVNKILEGYADGYELSVEGETWLGSIRALKSCSPTRSRLPTPTT